MNSLFISPHSDDSSLFGAFTLMREHPLVLTVTDSFIQQNRGEQITPDQRRLEDIRATALLGCAVIFGGLRDDVLDEWAIEGLLSKFQNFDIIYAPAPIIPGGNPHHNMIGQIAEKMFGQKVKQYLSYSSDHLYLEGSEEIRPVGAEFTLKEKALSCYTSQMNLAATKPHFEAVRGKSEWFI